MQLSLFHLWTVDDYVAFTNYVLRGFSGPKTKLKLFLSFLFSFSEEKFKKIDEEFTKCNTFLVSCLENITKRGAFPHCKLMFRLSCTQPGWYIIIIENSLNPVHWHFFFFISGVLGFCFSIISKYFYKGLTCQLWMHYWLIIRPVWLKDYYPQALQSLYSAISIVNVVHFNKQLSVPKETVVVRQRPSETLITQLKIMRTIH